MTKRASMMDKLAKREGFNERYLPSVKIYKASQARRSEPLRYEQDVITSSVKGQNESFLVGKCMNITRKIAWS